MENHGIYLRMQRIEITNVHMECDLRHYGKIREGAELVGLFERLMIDEK